MTLPARRHDEGSDDSTGPDAGTPAEDTTAPSTGPAPTPDPGRRAPRRTSVLRRPFRGRTSAADARTADDAAPDDAAPDDAAPADDAAPGPARAGARDARGPVEPGSSDDAVDGQGRPDATRPAAPGADADGAPSSADDGDPSAARTGRGAAPGPVGGGHAEAGAATTTPRPTTAPAADEPSDPIARATRRWRAALLERAGDSALSDVERLGDAVLDLSAAHPSGIAQMFAGRETRLSNLVRDGGALASARRRARAVAARADDHAQRYGLASAFLAIGVATWSEPGGTGAAGDAPGDEPRTVRAPVLLRPVAIRPRGRGESDYDLALDPSLDVNPLLAGALRTRGALLDPAALARGAFTEHGFDPRAALDRLRSLGLALLPDFELDERLLVGTFVHPEQALVDDLDALPVVEHEVLRALAGDAAAVAALAHPLPPVLTGDRPLEQERGVGDLDPAQVHVLDAIAAGHHVLVDAPTGSDVAGTLAAVVADAAAAGRTVLYVAGHRRAATALVERLAALGLDETVLDIPPEPTWRTQVAGRLLAAMTVQPVEVPEDEVAVVQRELLDRRRRLTGYIEALHRTREPWGASAYDALQALARLTSARPGPQTRVRLSPAVAESLTAERRAQAAADLVRASVLGAFSAPVRASAWYGADILTAARADDALHRVERLLTDTLPRVQAEVARVAEETGLVPATTPREWGEQLTMLAEVRKALDVFQPIVFERSAADLVAATATAQWRAEHGVEMSGMLRRRLRKQAKDLLRPGRPVDDLHAALVHVQEQRGVWQAHCPAGGWPRIPVGLADVEHDHRELSEDLAWLGGVLASGDAAASGAGGSRATDLAGLAWDELDGRLRRLRQDRAALDLLPERTAVVRHLAGQGLGDLLTDLEDRQVPAGLVAAELDLAWWSTVFEAILRQDPALAGYDGTALARLVAEFRTLDRRHLRDRALLSLASSRELLRTRLRGADEESQALFAELVEHRFAGLRTAAERYPTVVRHLRPCLVASPVLVPQLLPAGRTEDLVVLDAAGHLPVEVVVPALARGRQVLVVGDTRSASGSALAELAAVLPTVPLHADASRRDPHLTAFLAEHGYAGRLTATPLPSTRALLRLDVVAGTGMPTGDGGAVESTQAEVEHVVELVVEHALTRPDESLAVVSASPQHTARLREAVMTEVRDNPALGAFFAADRSEPFVVTEVGATQGLSREAVILSVGFGRTPHGRVLHRFGALSEPGGEGRLLEAIGSTRHRLTVVSCFADDDLDVERLRAPGARLLHDLLVLAAERTAATGDARARREPHAPDASESDSDRLVLDLAERLWRTGLLVEMRHGVPGGATIPLVVGHPELPGEMLVAVLTDDESYVAEPSVRVRDRQAAERLERLGWTVVQVWSAAAFLDPQGEADAVVEATLDALARRRAQRVAVQGRPSRAPDRVGADARSVTDDAGDLPGDEAHDELVTAVPTPRGPRPPVERGLPVNAYSDDELDDVAAWVLADGAPRDEAELAAALRTELGITRHGARIDAAIAGAVRRALGS
ncbi:hypothetical protein [Cellulomonas carbonis]|nr:hypothetical protein [Cellulomonas carbonis]